MAAVLYVIAQLGGPRNRRFTGATQMAIAGPLESDPVLITSITPVGNSARGSCRTSAKADAGIREG